MKAIYSVPALLIASLFIFTACQKESSFERENTARYSVDGGVSSCTGATVSGIYTAGITATAENKVILNVTVDSIGSYAITSDTINGLSFSGKGIFTGTGPQSITLSANGAPTVSGTFNFTPIPGGCTFPVTVVANSGTVGGTAAYSFDGGTSSCTDALVGGNFTAGTATSSTNTVRLKITVNTIGTYSITTNTVNGIRFSGSGNFTATGAQIVTLTASGTPAAAGSFGFIPGSNACSFNVTVNNSGGGGGPVGGSGNFLKCKIDGVLSNFNTNLVGYYVVPPSAGIPYSISVRGKKSDVAGSPIELTVSASNPSAPTTGAYTNLTFSSGMTDRGCQVSWFPTGFPNGYWGSSAFSDNTFTVTISSVTTAGAAGTFSGTIYETNGIGPSTKQITEGEFKITF
ncbi:MAG: hypothetical protein J7527_16675 [Chitinophagaceae bacterium]|nr:hypothetical protein [Chitinophagaceae bacterium]